MKTIELLMYFSTKRIHISPRTLHILPSPSHLSPLARASHIRDLEKRGELENRPATRSIALSLSLFRWPYAARLSRVSPQWRMPPSYIIPLAARTRGRKKSPRSRLLRLDVGKKEKERERGRSRLCRLTFSNREKGVGIWVMANGLFVRVIRRARVYSCGGDFWNARDWLQS